MIVDHTDYSSRSSFDSFLSWIDPQEKYGHGRHDRGESFIYGRYEYMGDITCGYFCHLHNWWVETRREECGYTGTISGDSDTVNISSDFYDVDIDHFIFKRDFISLEDEIMRYGDFCVRYCFAAKNHLNGVVEDKRGAGMPVDKKILNLRAMVNAIDEDLLTEDCLYAIRKKKEICPYIEDYWGGPFTLSLNDKPFRYPFVTNIMSDKEKEFVEKWGKKKITSEYYDARERLHFEYLEEMASKVKLNYYKKGYEKYWKNPLKSFLFVVATAWNSFFLLLSLIVLIEFAIEPEKFEEAPPGMIIGTFFVAMIPGLLIMLIKLAKYINYKKALKAQ